MSVFWIDDQPPFYFRDEGVGFHKARFCVMKSNGYVFARFTTGEEAQDMVRRMNEVIEMFAAKAPKRRKK